MRVLLLLPFLFFLTCFSSCEAQKSKRSKKNNPDTGIQDVTIDANIDFIDDPGDYNIESVTLEKDIMTINVSYSGGCKEQSFKLISNKAFSKSLPPQVGINLVQNKNGDSCREIVRKQLKFNLRNLRYEGQKSVKLNFNKEHYMYTY
jgi:hypothetical protein